MSKKRTAAIAGVAGLALGLLVGPVQGALAGHSNTLLETQLNGRNEVGTDARSMQMVGDPNGRGEAYVFGIDNARVEGPSGPVVEDNSDTLCYIVQVDKIADTDVNPPVPPFMAHIHEGQPGENGPVVVTLAFPQGGESADCISEDRLSPAGAPLFARDPATGAPLVTAAEILASPDDYYVNVHTDEHPGGAIRGQLESAHDH